MKKTKDKTDRQVKKLKIKKIRACVRVMRYIMIINSSQNIVSKKGLGEFERDLKLQIGLIYDTLIDICRLYQIDLKDCMATIYGHITFNKNKMEFKKE